MGYSNIKWLQVGDRLLLNDQPPFVIRRIGHYASFEELLAHEIQLVSHPTCHLDNFLKGCASFTH